MKNTIFLAVILFAVPSISFAAPRVAPHLAPPSFTLSSGDRAVFVDFISAEYSITYDLKSKKTQVVSQIEFINDEAGKALFDLVDEPSAVELDGKSISQRLIEAPPKGSQITMRVLDQSVSPGTHILRIAHEMKAYPATFGGGVNSGFFMSDMDSRGLLERFLPANMEYDQVKMKFNVEILGSSKEELIFTNGTVTNLGTQKWFVEFPAKYNSSSIYFHIRPKDETTVVEYSYSSVDGRQLPVTIYKKSSSSSNLSEFKKVTDTQLASFEKLYGPFPHAKVVVYDGGGMGGGMEYAGATITDLWALPHELAHSYFGRSVMPANGNAGWIDEAMATYAGGPYKADPSQVKPANMANHSVYYRTNDGTGYHQGLNFLAYLDEQMRSANSNRGMKDFLFAWAKSFKASIVTTPMFQASVESYSGLKMTAAFNKYVYGLGGVITDKNAKKPRSPDVHITREMARALQ